MSTEYQCVALLCFHVMILDFILPSIHFSPSIQSMSVFLHSCHSIPFSPPSVPSYAVSFNSIVICLLLRSMSFRASAIRFLSVPSHLILCVQSIRHYSKMQNIYSLQSRYLFLSMIYAYICNTYTYLCIYMLSMHLSFYSFFCVLSISYSVLFSFGVFFYLCALILFPLL